MRTICLLAATVALLTTTAAHAETLKLKIQGLQPRGGWVMVAVQSRDQYMQPAMVGGRILDGTKTSGETTIELPLPKGEYAVTVLHDADANMNMTLGANGLPAEGWATVNQARLRAKPTFDQVKFSVTGDTTITLPVVYPAK